jgi:hypothetical protein
MSVIRTIQISLLTVLLLSPVRIQIWEWNAGEFNQSSFLQLPDQFSTITLENPIAFNQNDCATYSENHVRVSKCNDPDENGYWESPVTWDVREMLVSDLNGDGSDEMVLLVWRPFKPWPIDRFLPSGGRINGFQNSEGMSCHVILVGWDGQKYRELWAGSAMANPLSHLQVADLDSDGNPELVAIEGIYDSHLENGPLVIWKWQGFGFYLLDRSKESVSNYQLVSTSGKIQIVSNE